MMASSNAFDLHAAEYDAWFENHHLEYGLELDAIRKLLPTLGNGVEIGVGTGRFAQPLGIKIGVEPSAAMRQLASHRGIQVVAGTAELLPFNDNSYDFALLVTTVCFLESLSVAFSEISRILKKGGFMLIGLIDKNSRLGHLYEQKKTKNVFYKDANFHSVEEILAELKRLGFHDFEFAQALFPGDNERYREPLVKEGYGEGSFVVLRAQKGDDTQKELF